MTMRQLQIGIAAALAIAVVSVFFIFNPFAVQEALTTSDTNSVTGTGSLVVQDVVVGSGVEAQPGDMLTVSYTGKLEDGSVFDTSVGKPSFKFILGNGDVIAGWDQGLQGMKAGGRRTLIIPPSLGYGAAGFGPIPPNATLTFDVELISVTPAAEVVPFPEGEGL